MRRTVPVCVLAVAAWCLAWAGLAAAQPLNVAFERSTVLVNFEISKAKASYGTGLLIFRPTDGDQGHLLLVTNRHLLPAEGAPKAIRVRVIVGPPEQPVVRLVEVPVVGRDGKYLPTVRFHPRAGVDLAAINVTEGILREGIQNNWLHADLLATPKHLKDYDIRIGDDVFVLGFPEEVTDTRNTSPLLRTGVVATSPLEGFAVNDGVRLKAGLPDWLDGFLFDAHAFPGAPGNLVILRPQAPVPGVPPSGRTVPYILGMASGAIAPDAGAGAPRAGLGIAFSAQAIRTIIEAFPK